MTSASLFCRADSAYLCLPCDDVLCGTCDRDIHSANLLALRHERFLVVSFNDAIAAAAKISGGDDDLDVNVARIEAEAALWLLDCFRIRILTESVTDLGKII
ncbi:putative transcription factor interactor and regulator Znf-B family [Helianthus anomalus]